MSFQLNLPPSMVRQMAKAEESIEPEKRSREDYKKLKELEEARKAGTAPAMKDEEGKDINPHIPQYIMQAPWYIGSTAPTLKHQRIPGEMLKTFNKMNQWYNRGVQTGKIFTKFRKGACENCGAMTHKKRDCLERPRKVGAKYTGSDIAPDEFIQPELEFDYDGKRDRWNGYDLEEHKRVVEHFDKLEQAKQELKSKKLDESMGKLEDTETSQPQIDSDEDDDKYADDMDMPGQKFETKQRITVRNLRIREDTAKYLYNLDPNSAFYDPKTRSMRENPLAHTKKDASELPYSGDNFVRVSGDAHKMATKQVFAWEAYEKGTDVHLQADPTKLELLTKEYKARKDNYKDDQKQSILDRYGGEEHLSSMPKELLLAQTENYVEYSRHGSVIKGQEKAAIKSRYEEDVFPSNHQSVWGSYWRDGHWGFKCCHSLIKESYCTGDAGIEASMSRESDLTEHREEEEPTKSLLEEHQIKLKEKKKKKKKRRVSSSSSSSSDTSEDEELVKAKKLKEALRKEEEDKESAERLLAMDERKRPYNSMYDSTAPSEEQMEAFRMKRQRADDPMNQFL